jgi:hypothetical protein
MRSFAESPSAAAPTALEIRREMADIRERMCREASDVATRARQIAGHARELTDWKFYLQRYGRVTLGLCALVGYAIVPRRIEIVSPDAETLEKLARRQRLIVEPKPTPNEKRRLMDTALSLGGTMLLRAGLAYAGQRMSQIIKNPSPSPTPQEFAP